MKGIHLIEYNVKGIKNLDQMISLSFYKKTIKYPIDIHEYNIKGIYGMNGSGKSGIIASLDILRSLLTNASYLNNPVVQNNLDNIVNKKTRELFIGVVFLANISDNPLLFKYEVNLKKNKSGKYCIEKEELSYKPATSRKEFSSLFNIENGEILKIETIENDRFKDLFEKKSVNLLSNISASAVFFDRILELVDLEDSHSFFLAGLVILYLFAEGIYVYMDSSDNHTDYYVKKILVNSDQEGSDALFVSDIFRAAREMDQSPLNVISIGTNMIPKESYNDFANVVGKLKDFIQIFKTDLTDIEIDRKEDGNFYVCSLNMVYGSYSINAEFESTGIKKLIKLFVYIKEMVRGGIVFIDELDSNLHDVYLCALLEYLMEFGEGQLCFTTHNVGPMDVLKKNKKSIDFLSVDHKVYPWKTNGHYSPSKLYKEGMIEGSPFNVDSIDFIGLFDLRDRKK